MNSWIGRIATGTLALGLAGLLASCGGGGGGGGPVNTMRVFFGMNNDGACNRLVVDVDVNAANSILNRNADGSLDCLLNTLLDNKG